LRPATFRELTLTEQEITQISVGGHRTGIMGLKLVLESVVRDFAGRPEPEIRAALMERLGKSNYIVPSARAAYEAAFFREYQKFTGDPLSAGPAGPIQIKVLGQGCPSCDKLEQDVMSILAELGIAADLEHLRDIREIASYGVMGSPALVIDGKVVAAGKIPSKNQLMEWLMAVSKK
jgi:small redox-active disulfide protein 2